MEKSPYPGLPSTTICMSCHAQVWNKSPLLGLVREYHFKERPIPWNSVHNLPDFVYFNHSIHVNKGVGCVTCHGRVDQMALINQKSPLSMGWCVECHRNPEPHLRPVEFITSMTWQPAPGRGPAEARGPAGPAVQRPHAHLLRRMSPMTTPRFPLPVLGSSAPVEPQAVDLPDEASFAPGPQPGSEHGYGRAYWRSLEEQLHGEAALPHRDQEFPARRVRRPRRGSPGETSCS